MLAMFHPAPCFALERFRCWGLQSFSSHQEHSLHFFSVRLNSLCSGKRHSAWIGPQLLPHLPHPHASSAASSCEKHIATHEGAGQGRDVRMTGWHWARPGIAARERSRAVCSSSCPVRRKIHKVTQKIFGKGFCLS